MGRAASRSKSWVIAFAAIVASVALFLGNVKSIRDFFTSTPESPAIAPSEFVSEIPTDKMPTLLSGDGGPIEVAGIVYHKDKQTLDVRVRNVSDEPSVINQIAFRGRYDFYVGANLSVSGSHDLDIEDEAHERKQPLEWKKGFNVAYVVAPKEADRFTFTFRLNPDLLYEPDSGYGGIYELIIYFRVNQDDELAESIPLRPLLRGEPWKPMKIL